MLSPHMCSMEKGTDIHLNLAQARPFPYLLTLKYHKFVDSILEKPELGFQFRNDNHCAAKEIVSEPLEF